MKKSINLGTPPFRKPNEQEIGLISNWFLTYNKSRERFAKRVFWICVVTGACMLTLIPFSKEMIVIALLAAVCFLFAFSVSRYNNNNAMEKQAILSGDFFITRGKIVKIGSGGRAMYRTIWFESDDKLFSDGWYEVRVEEASIDTPIIFVRFNNFNSKTCVTLTPYMLDNNVF